MMRLLHVTKSVRRAMMGTGMTDIDRFLGLVLKGRYRLLQRVAEGRRGGLYRAERVVEAGAREPSADAERIAVKLVHALSHQSQEHFERGFIQEVQTAGALGEHNTLIIHDYGHADELHMFMVMEWLSGVDLARLIGLRGPLSARQALFLADQVLRSLAIAHARGVVHGDLTPEGLFVSRGASGPSVVKVMDFGRRRLSSFSDEGQSLVGMPTGWAHYLAPEQITGDDFDHRADLYALGCILYEALSGSRPFADETGIGIWMAQVNQKPKPLSQHAAARAVPAELEELVSRCLEKDPGRRYESAAQLQALTSRLLR
jgi:eukaryotic-like serine/threonine-protein kinase